MKYVKSFKTVVTSNMVKPLNYENGTVREGPEPLNTYQRSIRLILNKSTVSILRVHVSIMVEIEPLYDE